MLSYNQWVLKRIFDESLVNLIKIKSLIHSLFFIGASQRLPCVATIKNEKRIENLILIRLNPQCNRSIV